jgi:hypothetical protein
MVLSLGGGAVDALLSLWYGSGEMSTFLPLSLLTSSFPVVQVPVRKALSLVNDNTPPQIVITRSKSSRSKVNCCPIQFRHPARGVLLTRTDRMDVRRASTVSNQSKHTGSYKYSRRHLLRAIAACSDNAHNSHISSQKTYDKARIATCEEQKAHKRSLISYALRGPLIKSRINSLHNSGDRHCTADGGDTRTVTRAIAPKGIVLKHR